MPELPDVVVYIESLERRIGGRRIEQIQIRSPFVVRSIEPELFVAEGKQVAGFRRIGKRIVWELECDLFLVFHLMIAGRFHWRKRGAIPRANIDLIAFHFDSGTLMLTEAGSKKRASLHVVQDKVNLSAHHREGLDVLNCDERTFREALLKRNHTLKRALTDPNIFDGIGNAYSDEILHAARLSPVKWTSRLNVAEMSRLFEATKSTLSTWIERLRAEVGDGFPEKVTAFREQMAVHGRFGKRCPVCDKAVQRIRYAENETNYCPQCQREGKILADRSLSRLLKDDWPRTIYELEQL